MLNKRDIKASDGRVEPADPGEKPNIIRHSLTKDQVQAMVEVASDPQDKAVIMLVFCAGLRINELTGLTWDDVIDDAENPIKLHVTSMAPSTRQVLVERESWNQYVAPLFFANLEGTAAGCTSTPAEIRIFPVSQQRIYQTIEKATARETLTKKSRPTS